jgi:hypothetical protein
MEQSDPWETDRRATGQVIISLLWNPELPLHLSPQPTTARHTAQHINPVCTTELV